MPLDLRRYRRTEETPRPRRRAPPRWVAIALFEIGLALRRPAVIVLIVLAWVAAIRWSDWFITVTQGGLRADIVIAQGERFFSRELLGLAQRQSVFAAIVIAVVGAGMIARDLGTGAHAFLFSRDVTPGRYLAGKASAILFFLLVVLWLPCCLFYAWAILSSGQVDSTVFRMFKADIVPSRLGMLAAHLGVVTVVLVTLALSVSSFARNAWDARLMFAALILGGEYVNLLLGRFAELRVFRYVSFSYCLSRVAPPLYDLAPFTTETWVILGALGGLALVLLVVARGRVARATGAA